MDLGLTLEAAVAGQGVALGRPSLARHWLAAGSLRALFGVLAEPAGHYHLAPAAATADAARFADWLAGVCVELEREALARVATPDADSGGA